MVYHVIESNVLCVLMQKDFEFLLFMYLAYSVGKPNPYGKLCFELFVHFHSLLKKRI